jgi:hypothetical protein
MTGKNFEAAKKIMCAPQLIKNIAGNPEAAAGIAVAAPSDARQRKQVA